MIGYRGMVSAWQCDHYGHMNVQFYFSALNDSAFHLMNAIGLTREAVDARRLGMPVVRMETDFRSELVAGDLIEVDSVVAEVFAKKLRFHHRLLKSASGDVALDCLATTVCMDLDSRRAVPIPDDVAERARALIPPQTAA